MFGSQFPNQFDLARTYGWDVPQEAYQAPDWSGMLERKNQEISRLNGVYETMLGNAGVEIIEGRGSLVDEKTVQVSPHHKPVAKPNSIASVFVDQHRALSNLCVCYVCGNRWEMTCTALTRSSLRWEHGRISRKFRVSFALSCKDQSNHHIAT